MLLVQHFSLDRIDVLMMIEARILTQRHSELRSILTEPSIVGSVSRIVQGDGVGQ